VQGTMNVLIELQIDKEPFDTALLGILDENLVPTSQVIAKQFDACAFDLASRTISGLNYLAEITYEE
jgi:hypothetical protein